MGQFARKHNEKAQDVLKELLPKTGNSIRVGITGVPGAGKSTIIETLGLLMLIESLSSPGIHTVSALRLNPIFINKLARS